MIDFDEFFFDVLRMDLPDITVLPDLDNTALWDPESDPFEAFPILFFSVNASEAEISQDTWDDEGPKVWDATLAVTLLAEPGQMGDLSVGASGAIRGLRYTSFDLEVVPRVIVTVQRVRTTQMFTATGSSPLVGGKTIAQTSGQFTFEIKESYGPAT